MRRGGQALKELGAHPDSGAPVKVMKGRYGPYVTDGKLNATLPRDLEPEAVTMDEAVALLAARAGKAGTKPAAKKSRAAKKPAQPEQKKKPPARKPGKRKAKVNPG